LTDPYLQSNSAPQGRSLNNAFLGNHYADQYILNNQTITASSTSPLILNTQGANVIELHLVVKGTVSGTNPSLTASIAPYDPEAKVALSSSEKTTTAITATNSDQEVRIDSLVGDIAGSQVIISWTVIGTSPSFAGCYLRVVARR
jgi:hypothetical protein